MPRRKSPPRLYLDPKRKQWAIRDGGQFIRTGRAEAERESAERLLAKYLAEKHEPQAGSDPMIADVLNAYAREHLPHTLSAANAAYQIEALTPFWGTKRVREISAQNCRAYAATRPQSAARRDLETMRASVNYWHKNYGPLSVLPSVTMPAKQQGRQRWLTRSEAARLLWAARKTKHLARFILLGLYAGSRSGVILRLQWNQIDIPGGVLYRTPYGARTSDKKRAPPVRLGKRILTHLRRWKRLDGRHETYLCHYNGASIIKLRRSWVAARKKAKLGEDVTPHCLRHTRATYLMQSGITPWEAAGSLGMSVEMLTSTYGHHHPDWQKKSAEV